MRNANLHFEIDGRSCTSDSYLGERPAAYVTTTEAISGSDLLAWLNPQLGKHERVSDVVVRDAMPKTMIGKLDRKALRAEVGA